MDSVMIFEGHDVEVFKIGDTIYFNPRHVAECLNLTESAIRMAIKKMNENQVKKLKNSDVNLIDIRKLNNAGENFLTESGVYKLAFRSDKPEAERFTNWIADTVLPQIRKTGQYVMQPQPVLSLAERTLALLTELNQVVESQKQEIAIMTPKAEFCDNFLQNPVCYTATQIAEHYGMTAQKFNKMLKDYGVQYKQSNQWHLKEPYKKFGYVHYDIIKIDSKSGTNPTLFKQEMKWTAKGVTWIERSLRLRGITPVTPLNVTSTIDDEKTF